MIKKLTIEDIKNNKNFIRLHKEDYESAKEFIEELKVKDFQSKRLDKTYEDHLLYNFNGILGELAMQQYCIHNNIELKEYTESLNYIGRPYDLKLINDKTIDVKTINCNYKNLAVECNLINKHCCDYYVLVLVPDESKIIEDLNTKKYFVCNIIGYATGEEVRSAKTYNTKNLPFKLIFKNKLHKNMYKMI